MVYLDYIKDLISQTNLYIYEVCLGVRCGKTIIYGVMYIKSQCDEPSFEKETLLFITVFTKLFFT